MYCNPTPQTQKLIEKTVEMRRFCGYNKVDWEFWKYLRFQPGFPVFWTIPGGNNPCRCGYNNL